MRAPLPHSASTCARMEETVAERRGAHAESTRRARAEHGVARQPAARSQAGGQARGGTLPRSRRNSLGLATTARALTQAARGRTTSRAGGAVCQHRDSPLRRSFGGQRGGLGSPAPTACQARRACQQSFGQVCLGTSLAPDRGLPNCAGRDGKALSSQRAQRGTTLQGAEHRTLKAPEPV